MISQENKRNIETDNMIKKRRSKNQITIKYWRIREKNQRQN